MVWQKTGTSTVSKIAFDNGTVVKAVAASRKRAINDMLNGTRTLVKAGLPCLPILETWRDDEYVYFRQQRVSTRFQWTYDMASTALEVAEKAFELGVNDLYPDNWGITDEGELVITDAGCLTWGDEDIDGPMFAEVHHQLLYVAD